MMSKQDMIAAIRRVNRTVPVDFLESFEDRELDSYLRRLEKVWGHRGRQTAWVREGDTHAVVTTD